MKVSYPEDGLEAQLAAPGATLLQVSVANKIPHNRECGGHGRCTTCRVRILEGLNHVSRRTDREAHIAETRDWDDYTRLACQTRVTGDVSVQRLVQSPADVSLLQADALRAEPGKEVNLAILICDIRRFTPFVDTHLPYDVYHILNRFFGGIGEPILLNNGLIYQYIGDQIVGLFGLQDESAADACLSAVRAGLGMIDGLRDLNEQIVEDFKVRLDIRLGAHYGPLVAGHMGHPTRRDFSVVGDAINVASRIESTNEVLGSTFLVSEVVADHLPSAIEAGFQGSLALKGKEGRHTVIEVLDFAEPDLDLIVQKSARHLLGNEDEFADVFYRRLFEIAPSTKAMFTGDLKMQGRMLTHTLKMAVYALQRFESVIPGLVAIAQSHLDYGVRAEHYKVFEDVFLATTREILGAKFTDDVDQAWRRAIGRICDVMRKSSNHTTPAPGSSNHASAHSRDTRHEESGGAIIASTGNVRRGWNDPRHVCV